MAIISKHQLSKIKECDYILNREDVALDNNGYPAVDYKYGKYRFILSCVADGPGTVETLFMIHLGPVQPMQLSYPNIKIQDIEFLYRFINLAFIRMISDLEEYEGIILSR